MIRSGTDVNKYLSHGMSNEMVQFYMKNGGQQRVMSLPICPRCEKVGLRDKGWALHRTMICPDCGFRGHATHQLSTYLDGGMYR